MQPRSIFEARIRKWKYAQAEIRKWTEMTSVFVEKVRKRKYALPGGDNGHRRGQSLIRAKVRKWQHALPDKRKWTQTWSIFDTGSHKMGIHTITLNFIQGTSESIMESLF